MSLKARLKLTSVISLIFICVFLLNSNKVSATGPILYFQTDHSLSSTPLYPNVTWAIARFTAGQEVAVGDIDIYMSSDVGPVNSGDIILCDVSIGSCGPAFGSVVVDTPEYYTFRMANGSYNLVASHQYEIRSSAPLGLRYYGFDQINFFYGYEGNFVLYGLDIIPPPPVAIGVSELKQYKSDGLYVLEEGDISNDSTVVFEAKISSVLPAKLQIELKDDDGDFNESNLLISDLTNSGMIASVVSNNLLSGADYKWRARAVTEDGLASDWVYFGDPEFSDFTVKLVELYTQNNSPYPSYQQTSSWANLDYGTGKGGCGRSIASCGCYMVSSVMILRYYDVVRAQGGDVNPKTLNTWLIKNKGYNNGTDLNPYKVMIYTGNKVRFAKRNDKLNDFALADSYLIKAQPVIAKEEYHQFSKRKQKIVKHTHFILIDNKLASTYGVKDPAFFDTKSLDEDSLQGNARDYKNEIYGLRIYEPNPSGIASASIMFT